MNRNNIFRPNQPEPNEEPEPIVIDQRDLRKFILRVYLCAAGLCLLSAIPWICVSALKPPIHRDVPVPPFIWLIFSFVLLTILSCIPQTPVNRMFCWVLVLSSLFFITLFGCYFVTELSVWVVVGSLAVALILLALLHVYGALAPMFLQPNLFCTCCLVLIGFITLFALLMMSIFTNDKRYFLASTIVFFIIVICLVPPQASYICGRLKQVPFGEIANCANGVYLHFCFLSTCLMIFVQFKLSYS
ncbi:hypothetical protein KR038_009941 [Drosophila bunnanda]|nr:hypothetical protein KR038_009941 [Drosophila bunnanda]